VLGVGSDVPLLIVFDAAPDTDRVHLHGAYAAANSDDANRIDCALDAAGGEWAAPRGDSYKLLPKVLGEESGTVDGWLVYLLKSITAAGQVVAGGPLWSRVPMGLQWPDRWERDGRPQRGQARCPQSRSG